MKYVTGLLFVSMTLAAEVANMGGSWVLNVERSRFGNNPHPAGVTLNIEHNEPKFKYAGTVNQPNEGQFTNFSFDGAIDGKEYVAKEDRGDRKTSFRRRSDRVIESMSKFEDGTVRSTITMSADGKTLERQMHFRDRDGKERGWVEIYEKKK